MPLIHIRERHYITIYGSRRATTRHCRDYDMSGYARGYGGAMMVIDMTLILRWLMLHMLLHTPSIHEGDAIRDDYYIDIH